MKSFFILLLTSALFSFGTVNETVEQKNNETPKEKQQNLEMKTYQNGLLPLPDGKPVVVEPLPLPIDPPPYPVPMPNPKEKSEQAEKHRK